MWIGLAAPLKGRLHCLSEAMKEERSPSGETEDRKRCRREHHKGVARQAEEAAVEMAKLLDSKLEGLKIREGAGFRLYDSDTGSDQASAVVTDLAAAAAPAPAPTDAFAPVASGDTAKTTIPQAVLEHKPPAQVLSVVDAKLESKTNCEGWSKMNLRRCRRRSGGTVGVEREGWKSRECLITKL